MLSWLGFLCKEQSLTALIICAIHELVCRRQPPNKVRQWHRTGIVCLPVPVSTEGAMGLPHRQAYMMPLCHHVIMLHYCIDAFVLQENKVNSKATNLNAIISRASNIKKFPMASRKTVKNIFILLSAFLAALVFRLYIMGNKLPKFNRYYISLHFSHLYSSINIYIIVEFFKFIFGQIPEQLANF